MALDYTAVAEGVDNIREVAKATVAGLVADGFTDREARSIVAGVFASMVESKDKPSG